MVPKLSMTSKLEQRNIFLLHCPVRGKLNASALAKDGLTPTEEARRIDFIKYLLSRRYPKSHIAVETVVLKGLGEKGRNKLRADVIVYDSTVSRVKLLEQNERLNHALLVAEIKRDSSKKKSGISSQLEPAMRQLHGMKVLGAYLGMIQIESCSPKNWSKGEKMFSWRLTRTISLIYQRLGKHPEGWKPITVDTLTPPENLVGTLFSLANIIKSAWCE